MRSIRVEEITHRERETLLGLTVDRILSNVSTVPRRCGGPSEAGLRIALAIAVLPPTEQERFFHALEDPKGARKACTL